MFRTQNDSKKSIWHQLPFKNYLESSKGSIWLTQNSYKKGIIKRKKFILQLASSVKVFFSKYCYKKMFLTQSQRKNL